jgi:hypothetical protein
MGSLPLRPGDSLTILTMALSIGFRSFSFLPSCYSSYWALTLTQVGTHLPLFMPAFTGRTLIVPNPLDAHDRSRLHQSEGNSGSVAKAANRRAAVLR